MTKELEIGLFNIYDVVVFEDENGITQDCVCVIGKDREVVEEVGVIQCNNHIISIYYDGSYTVGERDGKDLPYYITNKKIIHLYTLKNDDNRFYEIYPTNDYEAIDNANPSEALKTLEVLDNTISPLLEPILAEYEDDLSDKITANYFALKQALLKAQEQEKENTELKKVLSIIKEKDVNIWYLTVSTKVKNYKDYNSFLMNDKNKRQLTEEEFELLKRYFEWIIKK